MSPAVQDQAAAEAAHRYAERCQTQHGLDVKAFASATFRLNSIVSRLAELSREIAQLEIEVLAVADVLVT